MQSKLLVEVQSQLAASQIEVLNGHKSLEVDVTTISNLKLSLDTETAKVRELESALHAHQTQAQKAFASPVLQRHSPKKIKTSASVHEKVEFFEHYDFHHSSASGTLLLPFCSEEQHNVFSLLISLLTLLLFLYGNDDSICNRQGSFAKLHAESA